MFWSFLAVWKLNTVVIKCKIMHKLLCNWVLFFSGYGYGPGGYSYDMVYDQGYGGGFGGPYGGGPAAYGNYAAGFHGGAYGGGGKTAKVSHPLSRFYILR